jgi:hypothetical protein
MTSLLGSGDGKIANVFYGVTQKFFYFFAYVMQCFYFLKKKKNHSQKNTGSI